MSKNAEYLRALSKEVEEFLDAFEAFMALHVFNDSVGRGMAPAVFPRKDAEPDAIRQASIDVARAAGRATRATSITGSRIQVQGVGTVDPIAAWQAVTLPKPLLEPNDIILACHQMIGRLEAMIIEAQAETPPQIAVGSLHPLVWGAARRLWHDGHFRAAVAAAAEALVTQVKSLTGRNDVAETALWQQTFSADPRTRQRQANLDYAGQATRTIVM